MNIVGGRPLVLGTALAIATVGMSLGAAPASQAASVSCSSSTALSKRPVLRYGDTGSCVAELQRRLVSHGQHITVDGSFGPGTLAAVKAYQRAHHLQVDGVVGPLTWKSLLGTSSPPPPPASICPSHPVTFYGQSGSCVKLVQQLLIKHGYSVGSSGADGGFGPATLAAVKSFQRSRHLDATGVVDALTWKALLSTGVTGAACVTRTYNDMSASQRVGQLMMVGMETSDQSQIHSLISAQHVGNVVYLGGWNGDSTVGSTSNGLQQQTTSSATAGVGMLIAADQEGGYVQQLKGTGFSPIPTALTQGAWSSSSQTAVATTIGHQLRGVGVNVNLAPVAGTVPESLGTGNGPIGHYYREYGYTPAVVSRAVTNVVHGLNSTGEIATVKHFPGLGRIKNNTDTSSTGITDNTMTTTDPYLTPFKSGITAGAGMVMISLAWYPKIDSANQAAFSAKMITTLLRGTMGYKGVVVSDSLSAVAVSNISVGDRAVRFIAAGGDIALTGAPSEVPTMVSAILARMKTSSTFANQVNSSVHRVLTLKSEHGLLYCS
ncbi:glycoside hydrolase family 3 N-terminal domain-containing protein [Leekyejoonella antrihumi]|nr:glycoside hydrolase family 3 N-terminal domain-containing protein [Leekyejoonella antrihumi]